MAVPLRALLLALALGQARPAPGPRKLLVFLLDGFRSDYISDEALESLPGLKEIVSRGVKVDYLTPDFPTLSYPNYYTLMTGESLVLFWAGRRLLASIRGLMYVFRFPSSLGMPETRQEVCVLGRGVCFHGCAVLRKLPPGPALGSQRESWVDG